MKQWRVEFDGGLVVHVAATTSNHARVEARRGVPLDRGLVSIEPRFGPTGEPSEPGMSVAEALDLCYYYAADELEAFVAKAKIGLERDGMSLEATNILEDFVVNHELNR